jgi:hypothetical protein
MPERFRFANTLMRRSADLLYEFFDSFEHFFISLLPVKVIFPGMS